MIEGPKVVFVIGKGRSGSTVLDNALGQVDGFFSLGEVWRWRRERALDENDCGCGRSVKACPVWSQALRLAGEELTAEGLAMPSSAEVLAWEKEVTRWSRVPRLLRRAGDSGSSWPAFDSLSRFAGALYRSVARVTGAHVLIDSSKWPGYPGPLGCIAGISSYVIHLVRDPRAVAFSWHRSKRWSEHGEPMPRYGALYSALSWNARQLFAERVGRAKAVRGLLVRYEDFAEHPGHELRRLLGFLDEHPLDLPFTGERTLLQGENHTVMGNPSRFQKGAVEVTADVEWRSALGTRDALLITAVTYPLLRRYGYPVRVIQPG